LHMAFARFKQDIIEVEYVEAQACSAIFVQPPILNIGSAFPLSHLTDLFAASLILRRRIHGL
jgi:hypothetical protein